MNLPSVAPSPDASPTASVVDRHTPVSTQVANVIAVFAPLAGFVLSAVLLWGRGFDWVHAGIFLGMYGISALGITVGYHRYFCHRSFRTYRPVQFMLAVFGAMALEGPVLKWVAMHRCHHRHSDHDGDPHSPHLHGQGIWSMLKGMFHAHIGWIFGSDPKNLARFIPDLQSDRIVHMRAARIERLVQHRVDHPVNVVRVRVNLASNDSYDAWHVRTSLSSAAK